MKISTETIAILKNFGTINQGIHFREGNVLKTVSIQKNILAQAVIEESIPCDFGIYDLNNFLSVVTLHKDEPTFEFTPNYAMIGGKGGRSKIKYRFCSPTMIKTPPEKAISMPTPEISFELTTDDFMWVMRAAAVLANLNVAVTSDGDKVYITTLDVENDSAHTESLEIADGNGSNYKMVFKTQNLMKILQGDYDVSISSQGISMFKSKDINLCYWIATESGSFYKEAE